MKLRIHQAGEVGVVVAEEEAGAEDITAAWQIIMEMEAGILDVGVDMVEEVAGVEGEVAILVGEEEEAMDVVEKCNIISLVVITTMVNEMDHLPKAEAEGVAGEEGAGVVAILDQMGPHFKWHLLKP